MTKEEAFTNLWNSEEPAHLDFPESGEDVLKWCEYHYYAAWQASRREALRDAAEVARRKVRTCDCDTCRLLDETNEVIAEAIERLSDDPQP